MTSKEVQIGGNGVGFLGLLTLVFVAAKLFDKIDWSWWWVFSPLWMPWVVIGGITIVGGGLFLIFWGGVSAYRALQVKRRQRIYRQLDKKYPR